MQCEILNVNIKYDILYIKFCFSFFVFVGNKSKISNTLYKTMICNKVYADKINIIQPAHTVQKLLFFAFGVYKDSFSLDIEILIYDILKATHLQFAQLHIIRHNIQ